MLIVYHPTYQGEIRDQHSKAGKLHLPPGTDVPERTAQREALAAEHSKRREGVDKLHPFDASLQCNPGIPSTSAVCKASADVVNRQEPVLFAHFVSLFRHSLMPELGCLLTHMTAFSGLLLLQLWLFQNTAVLVFRRCSCWLLLLLLPLLYCR